MKALIALALSLVLSNAEAATTTKAPASNATNTVTATATTGAPVYEGAKKTGVSLYYSLANQIELEGVGFKGYVNSKNPLGFGLRTTKVVKNDLGYHAGIFFEFGHNAESLTLNNIRENRDDKTFSFLYIDPSATYGLNNNVYLIGGLNYSLPTKNVVGLTAKGDLGYQIGAGYQINNAWSVDAQYREINFRMGQSNEMQNIDFDKARMSGVLVKANVSLE